MAGTAFEAAKGNGAMLGFPSRAPTASQRSPDMPTMPLSMIWQVSFTP